MKPIIIFLSALFSLSALASDHIDGPITSHHSVSDISDLYVFPTPNKERSLSLVMNSYPIVPTNGHFAERLRYVFRVRPTQLLNGEFVAPEELEVAIVCTFKDIHHRGRVTCKTSKGLTLGGKLERTLQTEGARLWTGMRSDPFFFNAKWAIAASTKSKILPPKKSNTMEMMNVLSIVLDFEINKLFGAEVSASMFAVTGEIYVKNSNISRLKLLDRVGRPEITNVSLVNHQGEEDLRDQYNRERGFYLSNEDRIKYGKRLLDNIDYYDNLDSVNDWGEQSKLKLANLLLDDFLVVDLSKSCRNGTFLSIEKAILKGVPHQGCGGRQLEDDIMDDLFSLYINNAKTQVRDGVDQPYRKTSTIFPYLAKPDLSVAARVKANIARRVAK